MKTSLKVVHFLFRYGSSGSPEGVATLPPDLAGAAPWVRPGDPGEERPQPPALPATGRKTKVVYLAPSLTPSGYARQIVELVKGLDKKRFDPVVVVFDRNIHYREIFDVPGVRIASLDRRGVRKWTFPFKLVSLLKAERPDLLHSFQHGANKWARVAGVAARIPGIVTSIRNTNMKPMSVLIERCLHRMGSALIVNSEAIERELSACISGLGRKMVVIHNGVDTDRFRPVETPAGDEARRRLGYGPTDFIVAHVGGASRRKNPLALMNALRILFDSGRLPAGLKVLFVGNTSNRGDEKKLRDRIASEPFGSSCRIIETVKEIESVYRGIDLLVLPSLWEGLPNVVVEAMSCGKPVIISAGANNCGVVEDGRNGWVFQTADMDRLADLIAGAAGSPREALLAIGRRARQTVLSEFSRDRMVEETVSVYDSLAAGGQGGRKPNRGPG